MSENVTSEATATTVPLKDGTGESETPPKKKVTRRVPSRVATRIGNMPLLRRVTSMYKKDTASQVSDDESRQEDDKIHRSGTEKSDRKRGGGSMRIMKRGFGSMQQMLKRGQYHVGPTETQKLKDTLPPPPPPSIDGTSKNDISLYATTWNMNKCNFTDPEIVQYWLPKGYDMYIISLQGCSEVMDLTSLVVDYLNSDDDIGYEDFIDNFDINDGTVVQQNQLILLFLVHGSMLEQNIFQRNKLRRQRPMRELTSHFDSSASLQQDPMARAEIKSKSGGVLIMQFTVFDTIVIVINVQLTKGMGRTDERLRDMRSIIHYVNGIDADHILLLGDTGNEGLSELSDKAAMTSLLYGKTEGKGWGDGRFANILERDEIISVLQQKIRSFGKFEEIPITFPPTSSRKVTSKRKVNMQFLGSMFHPKFDMRLLFDLDGNTFPTYNERIFYRTLYRQHEPGLVAHASGSCEGVTFASNVPMYSTFRIGNKTFSTPEEELIKELVDDEDLIAFKTELGKYVAKKPVQDDDEEMEQPTTQRQGRQKSVEEIVTGKFILDEEETSNIRRMREIDDEEDEEEDTTMLGTDDWKPNANFRPDPEKHRKSIVTVFDILSLPPAPGMSQLNVPGRTSFQSSISFGQMAPPPPSPSMLGPKYSVLDDDEEKEET